MFVAHQAAEDRMFPVGDDEVAGGPPKLVTVGLILLNVLVFLFELSQPSEGALQSFIQAWGVVPREYAAGHDIAPTIPLPYWSTLITSMFLHGGWLHLGGNMLYLWIFGDNLEKVMGHLRFLAFYLVCGTLQDLRTFSSAPPRRSPRSARRAPSAACWAATSCSSRATVSECSRVAVSPPFPRSSCSASGSCFN